MGLCRPVPELDDARGAATACTTCARSSTRCAGWCAPVRPGATCRAICRRGRRSTNKPDAGWLPGSSRRWPMTCGRCCAGPRAAPTTRRRSFSTVPRGNRPPRAGIGRATMATNGARAARSISPSTRSGICWPLLVTPANAQDREQVAALAAAVQEATGETVELAFVDQGYTGEQPAADAAAHGIRLEVVKLEEAKRGFVLAAPALGGRALLCLGQRASAAWPKTMNACRKRSLACISSPLPVSCCIVCSPSSPKVHNRL